MQNPLHNAKKNSTRKGCCSFLARVTDLDAAAKKDADLLVVQPQGGPPRNWEPSKRCGDLFYPFSAYFAAPTAPLCGP
jgi:hypothetical protein